MNTNPDLATLASLIADSARATMLLALMDNVSLPAGELARLAKITPQTASFHLSLLVRGNLVTVTRTGRHRYFRLSGSKVADALESLARIAPPSHIKTLNDTLARKALYRARTCYDHLAGELGVAVTQALIDRGIVRCHDETYEVTDLGIRWFDSFGINCYEHREKRRIFARVCLDWSERKPHIAGTLGAAILQRLFELKWIVRIRGSRAVKTTEIGYKNLRDQLSIELKSND